MWCIGTGGDFASRTWMLFTIFIGLITLLSYGVNLLVFENSARTTIPKDVLGHYNFVLFLINIILTIRLYIKTYQFLIPSYFEKALQEYTLLQTIQSVRKELIDRIEQKILTETCKEAGIILGIHDDGQGKIAIKLNSSNAPKQVTDINLYLLKLASKRAKKFRILDSDKLMFIGHNQKRLTIDYPEIAYVPPNLDRPQITNLITNAIKSQTITSHSSERKLSDQILLNKDLVSDAILSGRTASIESHLNQYIQTIEAFINATESYGIHFSPDVAAKENSWFHSWPVIDEIRQQYLDLLDIALKTGNPEAIRHFTGFLSRAMRKAIQYKDHYIFSRFANLFPIVYWRTQIHIKDAQHKEAIADRCGRLIYEIQKYSIEPLYENRNIAAGELPVITHYTNTLLLVLNDLIKYSIDSNDTKFFEAYCQAATSITTSKSLFEIQSKIDQLKYEAEYTQESNQKHMYLAEIEKLNALQEQFQKIINKRKVMFIGLGGWVSHLFEIQKITKNDFLYYFEKLPFDLKSLPGLSAAYSEAIQFEMRDEFPWSSWEMNEWPQSYEVTSGSLNYSNWLGRFYVFGALSTLPSNLGSLPIITSTSYSHNFLDDVKKQINSLNENKVWKELLSELFTERLQEKQDALIEIHRLASDKQTEIEEVELIQENIDGDLVEEFRNAVIETWDKGSGLRNLINLYGNYYFSPDSDLPEELIDNVHGVIELTPKGAFVSQNRIHYMDWGSSYGRAIIKGEDEILAAEFNSLKEITTNEAEFLKTLKLSIRELNDIGFNPIILFSDMLFHRIFFESAEFTPRWKIKNLPANTSQLDGLFNDSPIFRNSAIEESKLILVELKAFGKLQQYRSTSDGTDKKNPLFISVNELTDDDVDRIYKEKPTWLVEIGNGKMPDKILAERKIRQNVGLKIWQKFRFEEKDDTAGLQMKIQNIN
jgi:hypothetical protein